MPYSGRGRVKSYSLPGYSQRILKPVEKIYLRRKYIANIVVIIVVTRRKIIILVAENLPYSMVLFCFLYLQ